LILRPTTESNLDTILKIERDESNAPYIRQWSREKHLGAILNEDIGHVIIESIADSRTVGYVIVTGLHNEDQNIEFKRIALAEKGKGYGRSAVQLIKRLAFDVYGAHRLWLEVMVHNHPAYHLYESEGFVPEGRCRDGVKLGDEFITTNVMSVLEPEYRQTVGE